MILDVSLALYFIGSDCNFNNRSNKGTGTLVFSGVDSHGCVVDKFVDSPKVRNPLSKISKNTDVMSILKAAINETKDGKLSRRTMRKIARYLKRQGLYQEAKLIRVIANRHTFLSLDLNGDGELNLQELNHLSSFDGFGEDVTATDIERLKWGMDPLSKIDNSPTYKADLYYGKGRKSKPRYSFHQQPKYNTHYLPKRATIFDFSRISSFLKGIGKNFSSGLFDRLAKPETFRKIDRDGNGFVTADETQHLMGQDGQGRFISHEDIDLLEKGDSHILEDVRAIVRENEL